MSGYSDARIGLAFPRVYVRVDRRCSFSRVVPIDEPSNCQSSIAIAFSLCQLRVCHVRVLYLSVRHIHVHHVCVFLFFQILQIYYIRYNMHVCYASKRMPKAANFQWFHESESSNVATLIGIVYCKFFHNFIFIFFIRISKFRWRHPWWRQGTRKNCAETVNRCRIVYFYSFISRVFIPSSFRVFVLSFIIER